MTSEGAGPSAILGSRSEPADSRPARGGRHGRGVSRPRQEAGRRVAIKVIPGLSADVSASREFCASPRVLASLNHPNIAARLGVEERATAGIALVMELVEGETLAERIAARADPAADEALRDRAPDRRCARSGARARASSIAISSPPTSRSRPTATVKVLDFGLAKASTARRRRRAARVADHHARRRRKPA